LEAVVARVGERRTIGGMVIIGFAVHSPGEVRVTVFGGEVLVGRPAGPVDEEVERLARALSQAGVPAATTRNITGAVWGKVFYNCALNALGAVLGVPYGELARPPTWDVIREVVGEAVEVARAEGVTLPWPDAAAYLDVLASRQLPATAAHRASMLQDIERGRRTEIDHMNGAVARLGKERGVPTPVNSAVTAIVRFLEARGALKPRRGDGGAAGRPVVLPHGERRSTADGRR
jgi:2-dehydropantoate 2-reductase